MHQSTRSASPQIVAFLQLHRTNRLCIFSIFHILYIRLKMSGLVPTSMYGRQAVPQPWVILMRLTSKNGVSWARSLCFLECFQIPTRLHLLILRSAMTQVLDLVTGLFPHMYQYLEFQVDVQQRESLDG